MLSQRCYGTGWAKASAALPDVETEGFLSFLNLCMYVFIPCETMQCEDERRGML